MLCATAVAVVLPCGALTHRQSVADCAYCLYMIAVRCRPVSVHSVYWLQHCVLIDRPPVAYCS